MAMSKASPSEFATELRNRATCHSAPEDAGFSRDTILTAEQVLQDVYGSAASRFANQPLFLNARIRPVKVLVTYKDLNFPNETIANREAIYVPIWKVATSTVTEIFFPLLYNCSRKEVRMRCYGPHFHFLTPRNAPKGLVTLNGRKVARFHFGPSSASSFFDEVASRDALTFTVVRNPLTRFVSAWSPRTSLPLCKREGLGGAAVRVMERSKQQDVKRRDELRKKVTELGDLIACPDAVRSLEAHAHNLSGSKRFPYRRVGWIHFLSQAYFLSATDARGRPLRFDHVARMESFDADMRSIARSLGAPRHLSLGHGSEAGSARTNSNHDGAVDLYVQALKASSSMCHVCNILGHDYECLGYARPRVCASCGGADAELAIRPTSCEGEPSTCVFI